jgi:pSer/pThr/pTyr-binding forkhead associated (FHA) protein
MAKLVISMNGLNVRDYELGSERVTLGRNSGNDIVLNEPVVSGEHAVLQLGDGATITDLDSTNGTYLNGQLIRKSPLRHNDVIAIGNHELRFVDESVQDFAATVVLQADTAETAPTQAALKILNGPRAGEVMAITKQRTTLGKPGIQVAVILQQGEDYLLQPVAVGDNRTSSRINGEPVGEGARPLRFGDEIEIADARLAFIQQPTVN